MARFGRDERLGVTTGCKRSSELGIGGGGGIGDVGDKPPIRIVDATEGTLRNVLVDPARIVLAAPLDPLPVLAVDCFCALCMFLRDLACPRDEVVERDEKRIGTTSSRSLLVG